MADNILVKKMDELHRELRKMGYYSFQLTDIMMNAVGSTDINRMNDNQLSKAIAALESQRDFALKCRPTR